MYSAPASTSCWVRSALRGTLAVAIFILAATHPSGAQDRSVSARVVGPPGIDAANRQTVPVAILVANDGTESRQLIIEALLPKDWKRVGDGGIFSLAPGSRDLRLMAVVVPGSAQAGAYQLDFIVRESKRNATVDIIPLTVTILPALRLELHVAAHPSFVVAGAPYEAGFILVNTGNTGIDPELVWEENLGFAVGLVDGEGPLAPGDQRTVTLSIKTDPGIRAAVTHRLTLKVGDQLDGGVPTGGIARAFLARSSLETEVVPIGTAGEVRVHTLNLDTLTLATLAYSEALSATVKESISLAGPLDEAGRNSIEAVVVKELASASAAPLGPQDRISLSWWNRLGFAMVGTGIFSLLPLLASEANGFGTQAYFRPQGLRVAAMYFTDPWSATLPSWLGGTVGTSLPTRATTTEAIYSIDAGVRQPLPGGATFGVLQRLRPFGGLELKLETALRTGLPTGLAPAILADLAVTTGAFDGALQVKKTWPGFSDQLREAESILANFSQSLFDDNLRFTGSASWSASSLIHDPVRPVDHPILSAKLSTIGWIPRWGSRPAFGVQLVRQRSTPPLSGSDWLDVLLRASWVQVAEDFSLNAASTIDSRLDLPGGTSALKLVEELTLDWQETGKPGLSTSLRYEGRRTDDGQFANSISAGIGTRIGPGATSFEWDLQSTLSFLGPYYTGMLLGFSGSAAHSYPSNASLRAKLVVGLAGKAPDLRPSFGLTISYGTTPEVAIYRTGDSTAIKGIVFSQFTGLPLPGVLLRVGPLAAITDAKGEYRFNIPHPGMYHLQVDLRTLGPNQIPSRPNPIPAEVPPGSTLVIDIGIVTHASLTGSAILWSYPDNGVYDPIPRNIMAKRTAAGGIGNLIVELRDGSVVQRRITDSEGGFEFEEVRPGRYILEVTGGSIPEYSRFDQTIFEIELAPGEAGRLEVRVFAERRQIRMQQSGLPDLIRTAGDEVP